VQELFRCREAGICKCDEFPQVIEVHPFSFSRVWRLPASVLAPSVRGGINWSCGTSFKAPQAKLYSLFVLRNYRGWISSLEDVAFIMATSQAFTALSMLSRLTSPSFAAFRTSSSPLLRRLSNSIYPAATIPLSAISLNIPGLLTDIWEGVLRAVPKKKTSHMKRRHRQLAGKALKDVKSLNACPGCGEPKRAHHLCPICVEGDYCGSLN
jgi:large subunit ribosomal protein L32